MLTDKNAIITGSNRGIGRATVEIFAKNRSNIFACARKKNEKFEQEMADIADKYGVEVYPIYFDVTLEEEIKKAVKKILKINPKIDILVNAAGIVEESTSFTMATVEKMHRVFDVNFWGVTILTQYVSRIMMRNKKGSIINISSIGGLDGGPAQYEYAASKAAINGAVKQLSRELWQYGIRVNAVAPGVINTSMGNKIRDELKKRTLDKIIMGRFGEPEEIANVIAFLASDMSSYMTGQIIRVDGGM